MKQTTYSIVQLYPEMQPEFQHDYEQVRLLLTAPCEMGLHLNRLEQAIAGIGNDDHRLQETFLDHRGRHTRFDALDVALVDMESNFGFTDVVTVPAGGNEFSDPRYGGNKIRFKEWARILGEGHPFRDYGASLPHGELTHRIQWYLICAASACGRLALKKAGPERVLELYKACSLKEHRRIYHRESDDVKYVKSIWSDLFDYGLTKVLDGRSTLWIQREIIFCDWKNYFPKLSAALTCRFVTRGGSLNLSDPMNAQFFDGSAQLTGRTSTSPASSG